ncbi:MAG: S41 family peptidase [Alistipes sp.]|nr:S41 family peptidase [Alistipes sp.]
MKRLSIIALIITTLGCSIWATKSDFGLGRSMEILINMFRELSTTYVDEIDSEKLLNDAAAGMVRHLDPYTSYIPEEEMTDFDVMTTGKYGGVGSLIRQKGEYVIFAQPYKGSPADRAGIKIGDKILAIDGESAKGWTNAQVSSRLKGDPNTSVKVTIERLLTGEVAELTLKRERISIPGVPYSGWVAPGIGFIQHGDFTEGCYDQMRQAIERLQQEGELKALILDYRSNGGGILQEAVKIVGLFTPKGTEVVRTKGRSGETIFKTQQEPLVKELPLAVLINGSSASATEIVSGALQDLDRAVLIGQKSFGKGLVQSTRPLGYNSFLKLTTGKYYIPSGRCIQKLDYSSHDNREGREVADSTLKSFTTAAGRVVYDGGGIRPDIELEAQYISRFAVTLYGLGFIEDFVDDYMKRNFGKDIDLENFSITDEDYADFVAFMQDKEVNYESASRNMLKMMKEAAKSDNFKELQEQIALLEQNLKDDKMTNLETYREEIIETINSDIVLRHAYSEGLIKYNLKKDKEIARAIELLQNIEEYNSILSPKN